MMNETHKAAFWAWYNKNFQAGWWRSQSMWAAIFALCAPVLLYMLEGVLGQWPVLAEILKLSPFQSMVLQAVIAATVIPWLRARIQPPMQEAALRQAVETGRVSSDVDTSAVLINVPGGQPMEIASKGTEPTDAGPTDWPDTVPAARHVDPIALERAQRDPGPL